MTDSVRANFLTLFLPHRMNANCASVLRTAIYGFTAIAVGILILWCIKGW